MSIRKLNSENAIIKTASVEVKTLTISGKQVTLAVFRQLPLRDIIADDGPALRGVPWGIVNYHPDKCSESGEHLHVVWQEGQVLARAHVIKRPNWDYGALTELHELFRTYVCALISNSAQPGALFEHSSFAQCPSETPIDAESYSHKVYFDGRWHRVPIPGRKELIKDARKNWEAGGSPLIESLYPRIRHAIKANEQWLASYADLYEQLEALDQLFIAV